MISAKETGKPATKKRHFMSDVHLWVQALSDEGETMLVSVESTDRFDNNTLAMDCSDEEFRTIEASVYQVLNRTTANEPLRMVQQTHGQNGFESWHAIARRYDQRNMSVKNSAYTAPISNVTERDRPKDVQQIDGILRTFINATNNFENTFSWGPPRENPGPRPNNRCLVPVSCDVLSAPHGLRGLGSTAGKPWAPTQ